MNHAVLRSLFIVEIATATLLMVGRLKAQTCQDEEAMVKDATKSIADLVETVKKETLQDFENKFHQKSCVSNLTFTASLLNDLVACLDKASQDPAVPKEQAAATKTKRDTYAKLKAKLDRDRNAVRAEQDPKAAKAFIEKIDLSN